MRSPLFIVLVLVALVVSLSLVQELRVQEKAERFRVSSAPERMAWLSGCIIRYYENNSAFPERLDQLVLDPTGISWVSDLLTTDVWGREYRLNLSADGKSMLVTSHGRDGQIGGLGDDADLVYKLTVNTIEEKNHSWLILVVTANNSDSALKELRQCCDTLGTNWMRQFRVLDFEFQTNEPPKPTSGGKVAID
jgi:general secretion pathway protein G